MYIKYLIFITVIGCSHHLAALAQPYTPVGYKHHTAINSTLPTHKVYKLMVHKNGYIYASSDIGLLRYNGYGYTCISGMPYRDLVGWYHDTHDSLWLYDYNGSIYCYDITTNALSMLHSALIVSDTHAKITPRPYLFAYETKDRLYFHKYFEPEMLALSRRDHTLSYDNVSFKRLLYLIGLNKRMLSLDTMSDASILQAIIPNCGGIYPLADSFYTIRGDVLVPGVAIPIATEKKNISGVKLVQDTTYLSLLNAGLFRYYPVIGKGIVCDTMLLLEEITNFDTDDHGNVWISTLNDGIYHKSPFLQRLRPISIGRDQEHSMPIASIVNLGNNICIYPNKSVQQMYLLQPNGYEYTVDHQQEKLGSLINAFTIGDKAYLCTKQNLYLYDHDTFQRLFTPVSLHLKDAKYAAAYHTFFVASNYHILRYQPDKGEQALFYFDNKNIQCISILSDSSYLIGTSTGLYINNNPIPGWESGNIKRIIDHQGGHYLITDKGVIYISLDHNLSISKQWTISPLIADNGVIYGDKLLVYNQSYAAAYGTRDHKYIQCISSAQWPVASTINAIAVQDKQLLIGTSSGLYTLSHDYLDQGLPPPKIYIYNPRGLLDSGTYTTPYQPNAVLNLSVDIIDYHAQPYTTSYSISKDQALYIPSTIVNNQKISLSNLDPGTYQIAFHIMHSISERIVTKHYTLIITPLWYQTIWAHIALWLSIIGALYYLIALYIRKTRSRVEQKYATLQRIAELELKSNLNQLKPHFLFNIINPIQYYLLQGNAREGIEYLQRFSSMMRSSLEVFRSNTITIDKELSFLSDYLYLQQRRYSDKFDYSINIDATESLGERSIPSMMIQPIVENAIEHGFNKIKYKGLLELKISSINEKYIEITIKDNGNGISVADPVKEHHALAILQEKIAHLKATHPSTSIALIDQDPGLAVIIIVPIL